MLVIMLLGSINYDNALGYLLTFLVAGLFFVGMLHTFRNLAGIRYRHARAKAVFAGESAVFLVTCENTSGFHKFALEIGSWPRGLSRREKRHAERFEFEIEAHGRATAPVPIFAPRRGYLELGRLRIMTSFPLGILRSWAYFQTHEAVVVYPKPHGNLALPYADDANDGYAETNRPGYEDFSNLREYRGGDPIRAIAWKTAAREQPLMVKRFSERAEREVRLDWQTTESRGGIEARLSQLCKWVLEAEQGQFNYALNLPGNSIPFGRGEAHRDQCLMALALYNE